MMRQKNVVDDLSMFLQDLREITSAIADMQRQLDRLVERISRSMRILTLDGKKLIIFQRSDLMMFAKHVPGNKSKILRRQQRK